MRDHIEFGLRRALHIREERLTGHREACRVLYVSDIHLRRGRAERLSGQVLDAAARARPDLVLLGGDLVDRSSELGGLRELVGGLRRSAPVLAVGGNHDHRVGLGHVRDAVVSGGGRWIHDAIVYVKHRARRIAVAGPAAQWPGDADVRILCAHNPRIWRTCRDAGFHLVLAGHLHGFQLVAFARRDRLFPGAWFYPYCYLSHQRGPTRLVVSRGVSDLLPVRWRCPREVVLCHV